MMILRRKSVRVDVGQALICAAVLAILGCGGAPDPEPTSETDPPVDTEVASAPASPSRPVFREVTAEAGIDFKHVNGMTGEFHYPEIMGGGLCFFDADGDVDLDLYLVLAVGRNILEFNDVASLFFVHLRPFL